MQEEIVDEVLKVEKNAEEIVNKAREEASLNKNNLEIELDEKIKTAKNEAQKYIQESVKKAKEEADKKYNQALCEAERKNQLFLKENENKLQTVTEDIVKFIITPEYLRERG